MPVFSRALEKTLRRALAIANEHRHELASLLHAGDIDDLTLHLIASHHGWGRPHFEPKAYDRQDGLAKSTEAINASLERFIRLQQQYGPWGLAYLEAIFKAADGIASAADPDQPLYA